MRGSPAGDFEFETAAAIIMREYHQPFSEIKEMTIEEIIFFTSLSQNIIEYTEYKLKNRGKR